MNDSDYKIDAFFDDSISKLARYCRPCPTKHQKLHPVVQVPQSSQYKVYRLIVYFAGHVLLRLHANRIYDGHSVV